MKLFEMLKPDRLRDVHLDGRSKRNLTAISVSLVRKDNHQRRRWLEHFRPRFLLHLREGRADRFRARTDQNREFQAERRVA